MCAVLARDGALLLFQATPGLGSFNGTREIEVCTSGRKLKCSAKSEERGGSEAELILRGLLLRARNTYVTPSSKRVSTFYANH